MKESLEDLMQKIQKEECRRPKFVSCLSERAPVQGGDPVPCDRAQALSLCERLSILKAKRLILPQGSCLEVLRIGDYSPGRFVNPFSCWQE